MNCQKCGSIMKDGDMFCMHCGARQVEAPPPVKEKKAVCKNCGNEFDAVYEVCPNCGTVLETAAEPQVIEEKKFCIQCGKQFSGSSDTCPECTSKKAYTPNYQNDQSYSYVNANAKDYTRLGGWLAFFAYGHLAGAVLLAIYEIIGIISFVKIANLVGTYSSYYGARQTMALIVPSLIQLIMYGVSIYFCIKIYQMIKNRNHDILKTYEIWGAANTAAFLLMAIFGGAAYIPMLLGPIGSYVLYEFYYRKSVRVQTYFGSDEYVKRSYFTKIMEKYNANKQSGNSSFSGYSNTYSAPVQQNIPVQNNKPVKYCIACKTPMALDDVFCPKCGSKNESPVVQTEAKTEAKEFCKYCGAEMMQDAGFCIKCGKAK